MLDERDIQWLNEVGPAVKVTIIVESAEHGRALRKFLPGWRLLTLVPAAGQGAADADVLNSPASHFGTITTLVYAAKYGIDVRSEICNRLCTSRRGSTTGDDRRGSGVEADRSSQASFIGC
jgi:hypothetical protein